MRNRLVPKLMILIPGGDPGDKRIVAFGASENSAYRIFKKSCKCGNERLVSYSWCRKMKAGSCRPTDVTKLGLHQKTAKRQSVQWHRPMQDFVYGEGLFPFIEEPTGSEIRRYHPGNFVRLAASQSPSKI